jgi:hypothetical protein
MKKDRISPNQLILIVMVLINVVVIREGSLLDKRLYLFLIGTLPLLLYLIFSRWKRIL